MSGMIFLRSEGSVQVSGYHRDSECCVYLQYDGGGGPDYSQYDGGGGGRGYPGYWPDQRPHQHQQPMMPPPHRQLDHFAGPSTLEYRAPPRRAYPNAAPMHPAVMPGMTDDSGLGL